MLMTLHLLVQLGDYSTFSCTGAFPCLVELVLEGDWGGEEAREHSSLTSLNAPPVGWTAQQQ
jgi:hypothetical protein